MRDDVGVVLGHAKEGYSPVEFGWRRDKSISQKERRVSSQECCNHAKKKSVYILAMMGDSR